MNVRRLNELGTWDGSTFTPDPFNGDVVKVIVKGDASGVTAASTINNLSSSYPVADTYQDGNDGTTGTTMVPQ